MSLGGSKYDNVERKTFELAPNSFVYFLMDNEEVVYVGTTVNLDRRILNHDHKDKCNRVEYIEVSFYEREFIEFYYIIKYRPKYNKKFHPPKGINFLDKLKKPNTTHCHVVVDFLKAYDMEPYVIVDGKPMYLQDELYNKWVEVYGHYKQIPLDEKNRLKAIAENKRKVVDNEQ